MSVARMKYFEDLKTRGAEARQKAQEEHQRVLEGVVLGFNGDTLKMAEEILSLRRQLSSANQNRAQEYSWRL